MGSQDDRELSATGCRNKPAVYCLVAGGGVGFNKGFIHSSLNCAFLSLAASAAKLPKEVLVQSVSVFRNSFDALSRMMGKDLEGSEPDII